MSLLGFWNARDAPTVAVYSQRLQKKKSLTGITLVISSRINICQTCEMCKSCVTGDERAQNKKIFKNRISSLTWLTIHFSKRVQKIIENSLCDYCLHKHQNGQNSALYTFYKPLNEGEDFCLGSYEQLRCRANEFLSHEKCSETILFSYLKKKALIFPLQICHCQF